MSVPSRAPLSILYEHPDWFRPLFAELERRGVPYQAHHASGHWYDPTSRADDHAPVLFNRMSPSAYLRQDDFSVSYVSSFLGHLEDRGVRVVNGRSAWGIETSKAAQISLLDRLGLPHPVTRVIHRAGSAVPASRGLRFPIVVKPDVGGSGAGVRRFDDEAELAAVVEAGDLDLGISGTALVQEFVPADGGRIVRVEVLDGSYLYGIRVYPSGDDFNLCPADVCQSVDGTELTRSACAVDAGRNGLRVEAFHPSDEIIDDVERIMAAAGIEVGGVEYLVDERDGGRYYYDVNALSNFVADGPAVLGFDPFVRLADWLESVVSSHATTVGPSVPEAATAASGA